MGLFQGLNWLNNWDRSMVIMVFITELFIPQQELAQFITTIVVKQQSEVVNHDLSLVEFVTII